MLREINFQRKKEIYNKSISIYSEQNKTIYDFVLKQDSQIKNLEKELNELKLQMNFLINKSSENDLKENECKTKELITSLIPISPSKEEIKLLIIDEQEGKEKISYNSTCNCKTEIDKLLKDNEKKERALLDLTKKIDNLSNEIIKINCNNIQRESKDNDKIEGYITRGEVETVIHSLEDNLDNFISQTTKKLNDFDNDFDRLIESLKSQFHNIQDIISQINENKVDYKEINDILVNNAEMNKKDKDYNKNQMQSFDFGFGSILQNQFNNSSEVLKSVNNNSNSKINQTIIENHYLQSPSFSPEMINNKQQYTKKSINHYNKFLKEKITILKNEVSSDFEKIDYKILNELQRQSNDIKHLYREVNELSSLNINKINEISLSSFENEVRKKADIEQLNYALEAQAKINEALCSANRIARWSWTSESQLKDNIIIWSILNINTSLDIFVWENESESIYVKPKGIYRICAGMISNNKDDLIFVNINNNSVLYSKKEEEEGFNEVSCLQKYIPLSDNTKIEVGIINNSTKSQKYKAEAYLEIKKVI